MNQNSRILLEVPFAEKDEAKRLGACWDPAIRKWYVPTWKETGPFKKWLPADSDEQAALKR